jgi:hypothetical protein
MIKEVALLIFGWRKTPERFVPRCAGFITAYLKDRDAEPKIKLPDACLISLSQLAYRRAKKIPDQEPRFIYFARELERVGAVVEAALAGRTIVDREARSVLAWHGLLESTEADFPDIQAKRAQPVGTDNDRAAPGRV